MKGTCVGGARLTGHGRPAASIVCITTKWYQRVDSLESANKNTDSWFSLGCRQFFSLWPMWDILKLASLRESQEPGGELCAVNICGRCGPHGRQTGMEPWLGPCYPAGWLGTQPAVSPWRAWRDAAVSLPLAGAGRASPKSGSGWREGRRSGQPSSC